MHYVLRIGARTFSRLQYLLGEPTMTHLNYVFDEACKADSLDLLIGQIGKGAYATLFGVIPDELAVMRSAAEIEHRPTELETWYTTVRIRELGDLTAQSLVTLGRAEAVIHFLRSIRNHERD